MEGGRERREMKKGTEEDEEVLKRGDIGEGDIMGSKKRERGRKGGMVWEFGSRDGKKMRRGKREGKGIGREVWRKERGSEGKVMKIAGEK